MRNYVFPRSTSDFAVGSRHGRGYVTMNHKLCPLVPAVLYVHAGQEREFCVNPAGSLLGLGAVGSLPRRNATDVRRGVSQFIVVKNVTTAALLTQAITCSIGASINQ